MNKVLIIFVCFLVIMAILVGAGYVQDRGFFGNVNQLSDVIHPVVSKVTDTFSGIFGKGQIILHNDSEVEVYRLRFSVNGLDFYCDVLQTIETIIISGENGGGTHFETTSNPKLEDTNYPAKLELQNVLNVQRVLDKNKTFGKKVLWTSLLNGDRESRIMTYSQYLNYFKGKDISLWAVEEL